MSTNNNNTITLTGTCYWAHVNKPETYQGKPLGYSILVKLEDEKKTEAFKEHLMSIWKDALNNEFKDKKKNVTPNLCLKETPNNEEAFKAKTSHEYKDKVTGEVIPKTLPIFDMYGEVFPKGTLIGNGSKVRINVTPSPYYVSSNVCGIKLFLNAVQVLDLVEYQASKDASSYGFETVEKEEMDDNSADF